MGVYMACAKRVWCYPAKSNGAKKSGEVKKRWVSAWKTCRFQRGRHLNSWEMRQQKGYWSTFGLLLMVGQCPGGKHKTNPTTKQHLWRFLISSWSVRVFWFFFFNFFLICYLSLFLYVFPCHSTIYLSVCIL